MSGLEGRAAIVTGGGGGIGRGIARRYAREGASVVVAERDEESGKRTAEELSGLGGAGLFVQTDVKRKADVLRAVESCSDSFGRVDILVNNAWGGGNTGRFEWKTDEDLKHGFEMGLMPSFWGMQAVFPHMKAQGGGSIISICSLNGVNAHMYSLEYNTAKEAQRSLTRTAAREWGHHQIRCNIICPAAKTAAYEAFAAASPENAELLNQQNPMGRMGDPEEDIAGVAFFLASDDSRYMTGNTLFVDGGGHINGVSWAPVLPDEPPAR